MTTSRVVRLGQGVVGFAGLWTLDTAVKYHSTQNFVARHPELYDVEGLLVDPRLDSWNHLVKLWRYLRP